MACTSWIFAFILFVWHGCHWIFWFNFCGPVWPNVLQGQSLNSLDINWFISWVSSIMHLSCLGLSLVFLYSGFLVFYFVLHFCVHLEKHEDYFEVQLLILIYIWSVAVNCICWLKKEYEICRIWSYRVRSHRRNVWVGWCEL